MTISTLKKNKGADISRQEITKNKNKNLRSIYGTGEPL